MPGGKQQVVESTTQSSEPWPAAQPYITKGLEEALRLFQGGQGFNTYPGSTVVPFSQQTNQALTGITNQANGGQPLLDAANTNALSWLTGGGMTPTQQAALNKTYDVATGNRQVGTVPYYQQMLSQSRMPGFAERTLAGYATGAETGAGDAPDGPDAIAKYLTDTASGAYLESGNPYYMERVNKEAGRLADEVNRSVGAFGRDASGIHSQLLGEQVGDFRRNALETDFNRERGLQVQASGMLSGEQQQNFLNQTGLTQQDVSNRFNAANMIGNEQQAGFNNGMGALGAITGVQQQNIGNVMNAGQNYFGAGQNAANTALNYSSMIPDLYNQGYAPYQQLLGVGSMLEGQDANQIQDLIRLFEGNDNEGWQRLGAYSGLVNGTGALGGTGTSTTTQPKPSPLVNLLGGLTGILGLFGGR